MSRFARPLLGPALRLLRGLRVLPVDGLPPDPYSPEYLYLVQQAKRVSLARTLARMRPGNLWLWPLLIVAVLVKWADLALTNTLVRALINEHDLMQRALSRDENERP